MSILKCMFYSRTIEI